MMERKEFLELYAGLGFVTVPLRPREKRPLRKEWLKPDPAAWRDSPPDANVGVLTGEPSGGLLVVDLDYDDGPFEVFGLRPRELAEHTLVVRTGRGWHVYTRAKDLRTRSPSPGVDLRGSGAMVVAPPSVHPSGARYAFVGSARRVAAFDELVPALEDRPSAAHDAPGALPEVDWEQVESWIALQAPKLQEAWSRLRRPPSDAFDRSRADFAVARCLWEAGHSDEAIVQVLMALPGSKAAERGEVYARRTVKAAARLPPRSRW